MTPKPKQIKRIQIGWSCCKPDHFHLHKDVAERCITEHLNRAPPPRRWTRPMYDDVVKRRESGETFKAIGTQYGGLSVTRVSQVYRKAKRMEISRARYAVHLQAESTASSSAE